MLGKTGSTRAMKRIGRFSVLISVALLLLAACGTFEIGIERPPASIPGADVTIAALATENARLAAQITAQLSPSPSPMATHTTGTNREATPSQTATRPPTPIRTEKVESTPSSTLTVTTEVTEKVRSTPSPTTAPSLEPTAVAWTILSNSSLKVTLRHPTNWRPEAGEGQGDSPTRVSGEDGFLSITCIGQPDATIDIVAANQAGHRLRPFGERPSIEGMLIQGQEARLIVPSADQQASMAMLIVRYPRPVDVSGSTCQFFALSASAEHIRAISHTLRFSQGPVSGSWTELPPGLLYYTTEALWQIDANEQPVEIYSNPGAVLSPDGTQLVTYDMAQGDLYLFDLGSGTGWYLARTPDRLERSFGWWTERPNVVLLTSSDLGAEPEPALMGYLTAIDTRAMDYRILDPDHDTGPGWIAPSPDGRTIAYGGGSTGWLYSWDEGTEPFDPSNYGLTGSKSIQIGSPAWSPDGTRLAWVVGGGFGPGGDYRVGIGVFDLQSQAAWVLHPYSAAGRGGWPSAPVWSPDGQWLAYTAAALDPADSGLWVMRADGQGEDEHLLGLGGNPIWSPDSDWLAYNGVFENRGPAILLAEAGTWGVRELSLSANAYLADWRSLQP